MQFVDLYYFQLIPVLFISIVYFCTSRSKKSAKMNIKAFPLATEFSTKLLPLHHYACLNGDRSEIRENINLSDYPQFPVQFNSVDWFFECVMPH